MLVSSAKIIGAEVIFVMLGKSITKLIIYRRKSRSPKTQPRGTPCRNLAQLETLLLLPLSFCIAVLKYLLST